MVEEVVIGREMSANAVSSAILHISDLHLGKDFEDFGAPLGKIRRAFRSLSTKGGLEMQAHDPYIVAALHTNVKMAARELGLANDLFDLLVVTGDISATADNSERFKFARQFLGGSVAFRGARIGLGFPKDNILCVPGNHDKLNEQSPLRYLESFSDLPATMPYVAEKKARNGMLFVFYGIDSNLYEEGNVAKGEISVQTLAWLTAQQELSSHATADSEAIRILLLHHHPCDLNKFRRRTFQGMLTARLTQLDDGDRLLDLCRDWIHVIMHGHEHLPVVFRDDRSGVVVISAGTTCERQHSFGVNSFFALLFQGNTLQVIEYRWGGGRFRKDRHRGSWQLKRPRANVSFS